MKKVTTNKKKKKEEGKPPSKNRGYWLKLTEKKKEQDRIKNDQKPEATKSEGLEQAHCTDIRTHETSTLVCNDNLNLPEYSTQTYVGKSEKKTNSRLNYSWESTQTGDLRTKNENYENSQ